MHVCVRACVCLCGYASGGRGEGTPSLAGLACGLKVGQPLLQPLLQPYSTGWRAPSQGELASSTRVAPAPPGSLAHASPSPWLHRHRGGAAVTLHNGRCNLTKWMRMGTPAGGRQPWAAREGLDRTCAHLEAAVVAPLPYSIPAALLGLNNLQKRGRVGTGFAWIWQILAAAAWSGTCMQALPSLPQQRIIILAARRATHKWYARTRAHAHTHARTEPTLKHTSLPTGAWMVPFQTWPSPHFSFSPFAGSHLPSASWLPTTTTRSPGRVCTDGRARGIATLPAISFGVGCPECRGRRKGHCGHPRSQAAHSTQDHPLLLQHAVGFKPSAWNPTGMARGPLGTPTPCMHACMPAHTHTRAHAPPFAP